ncbi:MAG: pyridoxal phosphate-dependent aminotransferase [Kordiimonadaceae bacterium]|jgi:aspartate/methionine/tyrosine aminotransferase|nr:pyridoxal phosphate-dependent aminotransferase [Kordiimonadaceae bacterium]MBT6033164.1 pyridoxal phosphate-dependent aminotransferase [Kordiimonadaceae bacterium]
MTYNEPWSKRHKKVTGGLPYSLSNSFAEPISNEELISLSLQRGDQDIVDQFHKHSLEYTPNGGSLDLLEEIAKLYGAKITAENIIVFAGGQVGLQTAALALLDQNSHSIVFTPGYQSVLKAPDHAGSTLTEVPLYPENNWQIDPQKVADAMQENTKYMAINEPYNPAGTLMKPEAQQQLKEIAEKNDIYVMSDEIYRLLEHDQKDRLPAMADLYHKGISCGGLSKPWGGCGITIGWLAFQDLSIKQKIIDIQYFGTACPSRASEIQAIMALRASDIIIEKNIKIIKHNVALLDDFVEKYSNFFEWVRPNAGAIAFMKFKGPMNSDELGEILAKSGISIKPAYVFADDSDYFEDYFRIGYGEKIMPRALQALIDFVEEHREQWAVKMNEGCK